MADTHDPDRRPGPGDRRPPSRHDRVLAVIPSAFVVALLVAHVASIGPRPAMTAASAVGLLALFDALFLNPPRPGSPTDVR